MSKNKACDLEYWYIKWEGIGDELWKRNVGLCCLHEVRWRGCGARLIGLQGRRCKLWWSGNQEGYDGVGVLVKEELYDKVVEVRKVNDRVMSLVIVFRKWSELYMCMREMYVSNRWKKRTFL